MEKKKKAKTRRILGLTVGELCAFITLLLSMCGFVAGGVHYLDRKFDGIDHRFERVETRLDNIEVELKKTGDLLDLYLTWRFIYVNDPARKNLVPLYDPRSRTIEFIDKKNSGK